MSLEKCGMISPTNPIIPATAMQLPVIREVIMKRILMMTVVLIPRCLALASPNRIAFNGTAKRIVTPSIITEIPKRVKTTVLSVSFSDPMVQNIIPWSCSALVRDMSSITAEEEMKLIITPMRSIFPVLILLFLILRV